MGAKHANWFVNGEDDGLAARDRAGAETQGVVSSIKEMKFAMSLARRAAAAAGPAARRGERQQARDLYNRSGAGP
jgi:hypothetical protein